MQGRGLMDNSVIDIVSKSSVMKVGKVIFVEGRTVKVLVDHEKNTSHLFYKGELIKSIVVGGYIKITKGFDRLIGKIEGESVEEDRFQANKNYSSDRAKIKRVLIIKMLGYFDDASFERGIKELPLIDNECFLLDKAEFDKVHHFVKDDDIAIEVGSLSQENGMSIELGINRLFASHIGIFGNTGSGKSYTLASLYHALFEKYKTKEKFQKNARFFLIDFNGEYVRDTDTDTETDTDTDTNTETDTDTNTDTNTETDTDTNTDTNTETDNVITEPEYKKTYRLSTNSQKGREKFPMPEKVINDPLIWIILLEATEKTQQPFIKRALSSDYINNQMQSEVVYKDFIKKIISDITKNKDKSLEKALVINFLKNLDDCGAGFSGIIEAIQHFERLKYHNNALDYYFQIGDNQIFSTDTRFDILINRGIAHITTPVENINEIKKIMLKLVSCYYNDIVRGYSNREHILPLINRLRSRVPDLVKVIDNRELNAADEKNLTIVSLKDTNIHMRKILPLIFCKHLYEQKKNENKNQETFLNIIIDEAHNVLSDSSQRESEQWKDYRLETFEEIIKEGRKFGAFLTISSQRPSDISTTILSQLHNYFLHRLINEKDIKSIERTVSYLDKVSNESLSIIPTGTCILAGLVAQVPVIIDINPIKKGYEPSSQTIKPTDHWGIARDGTDPQT